VRAGIAVDAALDEAAQSGVEPPTLAAIALDALQSGIQPSVIRRVVADTSNPAQPD
jgi:hypothetical protein